MAIMTVGVLLFWAVWAAWTGSSVTLMNAATLRARMGGVVLMLAGVAGVRCGVRLLTS